MPEAQGSLNEPMSYDAEILADVRGAFEEETSKPAEPVTVVEEKPEATADVPEPKADHPTDPTRYADGTFKPQKSEEANPEKEVVPDKPATGGDKAQPALAVTEQPAQAPPQAAPANPPPGWSVKSKAEWDKLPEHIRADVLKREEEVNKGFSEYSGMKELRPYVELARTRGTSLKTELDRYIGIENLLAQDFYGGIAHIGGNRGLNPQALLHGLASYLGVPLGQSNGHADPQQPGHQPLDPTYLQQFINPLAQEVNQIKTLFQQQQEAARNSQMAAINSAIERFGADPKHRYYANVEPQMAKLLGTVVPLTGDYMADLQVAYDTACRMDPEISELLVNERIANTEAQRIAKEKEAAEKAKQASRSITGSPSTGPVRDEGQTGDSIEDDVRRAYRAHAA